MLACFAGFTGAPGIPGMPGPVGDVGLRGEPGPAKAPLVNVVMREELVNLDHQVKLVPWDLQDEMVTRYRLGAVLVYTLIYINIIVEAV